MHEFLEYLQILFSLKSFIKNRPVFFSQPFSSTNTSNSVNVNNVLARIFLQSSVPTSTEYRDQNNSTFEIPTFRSLNRTERDHRLLTIPASYSTFACMNATVVCPVNSHQQHPFMHRIPSPHLHTTTPLNLDETEVQYLCYPKFTFLRETNDKGEQAEAITTSNSPVAKRHLSKLFIRPHRLKTERRYRYLPV